MIEMDIETQKLVKIHIDLMRKRQKNDLMNGGGIQCSSFMEYLKILKTG